VQLPHSHICAPPCPADPPFPSPSAPATSQVGLLEPTHGTALIGGYDIRTDMSAIYTLMGVCPQHDLLWETLTGREHLLFYGRLKGLKGGWGAAVLGWGDEGIEHTGV
jgi:hypothetical protein